MAVHDRLSATNVKRVPRPAPGSRGHDQIAERDTVTDLSGKTVLDNTVNKIVAADFQLSTDWLVTNVRDVSPGESALAGIGC